MKQLILLPIFLCFFAFNLDAQRAKDYYKTGEDFEEAGRVEDALEQYSKAIDMEPDYIDAYLQRARLYKKQGKFEEAANDYERAITFDEKEEELFYLAAQARFSLAQYDSAVSLIDKSLELEEKYLEAYQLKTDILIAQEDYIGALKSAQLALDLRKNEETLLARGLVYELQRKYQEAYVDFDDAISKGKDYLPAYVAMARVCIPLEKSEEALEYANKAVKINPKSPAAYKVRSAVYADVLQYADAINDISRNILIEPENTEWYMARGKYYLDFAQYQNAINDFTRIINLDGKNPNAYYNRAFAYEQIQSFEKAIADYEKLASLSEYDIKARKLLDQANKRLYELNRESDSPIILVENTLPDDNSSMHVPLDSEELTLRGAIKDHSDIKEVLVNGNPIQFIEKDGVFNIIELVDIEDTNMVYISAVDIYDNKKELNLKLIRTEVDGPDVAILAPIASDNGEIYLDTDAPSIYVEGKIADASEIESIMVNGVSASFRMDELNPKFSANIDILNRNNFTVTARDIYGNEQTHTFRLNRDAIALSQNNPMGKTWVVFIENSNYSSFASLEGPEKDVSLMRSSLAGYKIHNVIHKKDMSKKDMEKFFSIELRDLVKSNRVNSLMVWYAGHGKFINETGYWIPTDAQRDDEFTYYNINTLRASLQAYSTTITHVLVITDACESGPTFYQAMRSGLEEKSCNDWEATKFKSSQVFSSAGYELAVDNSQFTRTFSSVLDNNPSSCVPIETVVKSVKDAVKRNNQQEPKFGKIAGLEDEGGTFFFIAKD